ncbi:MAG: hypothetical protein HQL29_06265, partial [Candidatus Omnitrophica bacterium]|nr:hypothetical protein [Candidatus Omnitrophota bacterium]
MIQKIKKITFLAIETKKQQFVDALRNVGAVHINIGEDVKWNREIENELSSAKRAISVLETAKEKDKEKIKNKSILAPEEIITKITSLEIEKTKINKKIEHIENLLEWYEIWGEITPDDIVF